MSDKNTCHDGDQNLEEERPMQGFFFCGAELAFSAAESGKFIDL
ncbi:UNVERIFIED_ORG: hypothetical protein ABIB52_004241 [Arthrobacter sp. UYCu721]